MEAGLFLVVGGTATLLNMAFYASLVNIARIEPTTAAALSFLLVVPFHFIAYARIVFPPDRFDRTLFVRYVLALALSFALNVGLVGIYWGWMGVQPLPAQILGLIPAVLANYLSFKFYVFRFQKLALPLRDALSILTAAIVIISAATVYAAIAAMLLHSGPTPSAEAAATIKAEAIQSLFVDRNVTPQMLPELLVLLNATLFGAAPSVLAILVTGLIGLKGLIVAFALDQPLAARNANWTLRLAAGVTVLAAVMTLQIPRMPLISRPDILSDTLVILGATIAALLASGLAGALVKPWTAAGFTAAAVLTTLSGEAGMLVWMLAPAGLALSRFLKPDRTKSSNYFIGLVIAFACAALAYSGDNVFLQLLIAAIVAAVISQLSQESRQVKVSTPVQAAILFAAALILASLAYRAIATS